MLDNLLFLSVEQAFRRSVLHTLLSTRGLPLEKKMISASGAAHFFLSTTILRSISGHGLCDFNSKQIYCVEAKANSFSFSSRYCIRTFAARVPTEFASVSFHGCLYSIVGVSLFLALNLKNIAFTTEVVNLFKGEAVGIALFTIKIDCSSV